MDREITLRDYGRVLWSGRWLIVAAALAAALVGLVLSFVSTTTYTATVHIFLGQATTTTGVPVATPATHPGTAPGVLRGDQTVALAADRVGISPARVKRAVRIEVPGGPGTQNQPSLAELTVRDSSRRVTRELADAYAQVVLEQVRAGFESITATYRGRLAQARVEIDRLEGQIEVFQDRIQVTQGTEFLSWQVLLTSAQEQLATAQTVANEQQLLLAKANQIEEPRITSTPEGLTSSGSARNRVRTVLIAAVIGLLVGVVVTFVWRGSPAGRARGA